MTGFTLQTLGFPELHGGHGPIKLNLRKGLALLIYLAEARGAVARDVIATLLWPEVSQRDRSRTIAAPASSHRADVGSAHFRDRPHQRALVSGGRIESRTRICSRAPATEALSRKPAWAIGVIFSQAFLWTIVPSSTIGRSFAARRSGGGSCMGWNGWCRTRMPPANILPRRLTRGALSSSIR